MTEMTQGILNGLFIGAFFGYSIGIIRGALGAIKMCSHPEIQSELKRLYVDDEYDEEGDNIHWTQKMKELLKKYKEIKKRGKT